MYVIRLKSIILYITVFTLVVISCMLFFSPASAEDEDINDEDTRKLPILMYHAVCEQSNKAGKFVITSKALEDDLKYIQKEGYTTISFDELIDYVENGTELPEKPIMLTFDDGYFNNYCFAYPLLKEYNAKAIISIIGKYTDLYSENPEENPNYSHITWEQAREMCNSGLVEIENHSYNSHTMDQGRNGTKKKKNESEAAYTEYIYSDIGKLQEEIKLNLGYTPVVFTYPFGSVSEASYDILRNMGFKATLSCEEKINTIKKGNFECLYMLGRYLRSNNRSARDILQ